MSTSPGQTEIQLDADNLEGVIRTLNDVADRLDAQAEEAVKLAKSMSDELIVNGSVPPIYTDISNALSNTMRRMKLVNTEVTSKLRADAKLIRSQLVQQTDVQQTSARNIESVDTSLTS